jgi:hypothetical protein
MDCEEADDTPICVFCVITEINALSPGYNTFEKCSADAKLLTVFVKGLI